VDQIPRLKPHRVIEAIKRGAQSRLDIDSATNIGAQYTRALRCWREQFSANYEDKIVPSLQREYGDMTAKDVEIFRRKYMVSFI
jgi:cyclopropane fatty-acyl-phospholipid synthase-like methyltransferase